MRFGKMMERNIMRENMSEKIYDFEQATYR